MHVRMRLRNLRRHQPFYICPYDIYCCREMVKIISWVVQQSKSSVIQPVRPIQSNSYIYTWIEGQWEREREREGERERAWERNNVYHIAHAHTSHERYRKKEIGIERNARYKVLEVDADYSKSHHILMVCLCRAAEDVYSHETHRVQFTCWENVVCEVMLVWMWLCGLSVGEYTFRSDFR